MCRQKTYAGWSEFIISSFRLYFFLGFLFSCSHGPRDNVDFVPHSGTGPWDSYLAMNLNHRTFEKYKNQIEIETSKKLISRGESHVTVITPVEFWNILRPQGMTIEQINQLALKEKIQSTHYEEVCLGIGSAQSEETYFVVIRSPGLLRLRKLIQSKLKEPSKFAPHHFYPHITIGFTQKDLHESDGVIKDEKSCFKPLD